MTWGGGGGGGGEHVSLSASRFCAQRSVIYGLSRIALAVW